MKFFYKCVRTAVKSVFGVLYRHRVYGQEHLAPGRALIAPNHASFYDPPIIAISCPEEVAFLARKSLFSKAVLGSIIRKLNAYPVSGTPQDLNSFKLVCQLLNENQKVVVFPEGMRSSSKELAPVKSGIGMLAMRCHSPIIPVYIHGSYDVWSRKRAFPKMSGRTACVFGSPVHWQDFSHLGKKESQEAIAAHVRNAIHALKAWYDNGAIGTPP